MSDSTFLPPLQADILVVDDTHENLLALNAMLTAAGYTVRPVADGPTALASAQTVPPDLVLLDIVMPGMDGFEVCVRLKGQVRTRDIPVVFLSVLDHTQDKVRAFAAGGVDYIPKPFQADEVLARVRTHVTLHRLQQELRDTNAFLETQVQARTADLSAANAQLRGEIRQRQQHQRDKDRLLRVVRQQGEQLRDLTTWLLEAQDEQRQTLVQTLRGSVSGRLQLLDSNLTLIQDLLPLCEVSALQKQTIYDYIEASQHLVAQLSNEMSTMTLNLDQAPLETDSPLIQLSGREREVLQLLVDGKPVTEIADLLYITPSTVYTHRRSLLDKLKCDNVSDLIRVAMHYQLTVREEMEEDGESG